MEQKPTMESLVGAGKRQKRPRVDDLTRFGLLVGRPTAKKKKSNRKYHESYLQYGFIASGDSPQRPLCVVCTDTLSNDALKPSKLRRHFESRHPDLKDMSLEYFEQRKRALVKQMGGQNQLIVSNNKAPKKMAGLAAVKKREGLVMKKERKRRVNIPQQQQQRGPQDQVLSLPSMPTMSVAGVGVAPPGGKKRGRKPKVPVKIESYHDQVPPVIAQAVGLQYQAPIVAQEAPKHHPPIPVVAQAVPKQVPIVAQEAQREFPSPSRESVQSPLPSVSQEVLEDEVPSMSMSQTPVMDRRSEPVRKPPSNVVALRVGLSNLVASLIGEIEEPFTISEELILPACELIFREILGESAIHHIAHGLRPSEDEIAKDIEVQLLERIRESPWYALQVDDVANDVYNKAVVLVYVRYIYQDDVHEDFLCAPPLPANASATELFLALDRFMSGKLDWSFCVGLSTDGAAAAAAAGRLSAGFTTRVKQVAPECVGTHCVIHREMLLAGQNTSPELISVLTDVVNVINHVRALAVNSHLFEQLCGGDTDTELKCLLMHTEVRWLSRGRSLARVFEQRRPLQRFLHENNSPLAAQFADEAWVAKLAYLCDMFNLLNEFNLSIQGRLANVFTVADKVTALKAKLALWARRVSKGSFDMFHSLTEVLGETETVPSLSQLVSNHLASLSMELERYFPTKKEQSSHEWIRDPFVNFRIDQQSSLSAEEERQLIEVANDGGLKSLFWVTSSLPTFWLKIKAGYPELATRALKALLTFPATSLCEAGFVSMMNRKTEIQNRLQTTLRVSLVRTPRLDCLLARKHSPGQHPLRKENGSR